MQQLEAFRRDDFEAAFGFASAQIHQLFDRPRFEAMVRGRLPRDRALGLGRRSTASSAADGGRLYLFVRVRGANGQVVEAVYEMVLETGRWRINGVVTRPDSGEKA